MTTFWFIFSQRFTEVDSTKKTNCGLYRLIFTFLSIYSSKKKKNNLQYNNLGSKDFNIYFDSCKFRDLLTANLEKFVPGEREKY